MSDETPPYGGRAEGYPAMNDCVHAKLCAYLRETGQSALRCDCQFYEPFDVRTRHDAMFADPSDAMDVVTFTAWAHSAHMHNEVLDADRPEETYVACLRCPMHDRGCRLNDMGWLTAPAPRDVTPPGELWTHGRRAGTGERPGGRPNEREGERDGEGFDEKFDELHKNRPRGPQRDGSSDVGIA
jgi:hypothetical protein